MVRRRHMTAMRNDPVSADVWPGFVDGLANVIIVMVFVLLVFLLAQYYLGSALYGRDSELVTLNQRIEQLGAALLLERRLKESAQDEVMILQATAEAQSSQISRSENQLNDILQTVQLMDRQLAQSRDQVEDEQQQRSVLTQTNKVLQRQSLERQVQLTLANNNLLSIQRQLKGLQALLDQEQRQREQSQGQVVVLQDRLDQQQKQTTARDEAAQDEIGALKEQLKDALASKVLELSRYRSDFFGRMRSLIGNRDDVRIVGDRFVLQSEVFFAQGSADLSEAGRGTLSVVAQLLAQLDQTVPSDIPWLLQVEGHTDDLPIANEQYASNWELSTARAISVVRYLSSIGVDEVRLAAVGFAENQPLSVGSSEESRRQNRRIEFRLTQP